MGLEVAPFLDRNAGNPATSSLSFIDFLALPFFKNLGKLNVLFNKDVVPILRENRQRWKNEQ